MADITLADYFNNNSLTIQQKLALLEKVFDSVKLMHDAGYIHGDLSFKNFLYDETTGGVTPINYAGQANDKGYVSLGVNLDKRKDQAKKISEKDKLENKDKYYLSPWQLFYKKACKESDIYNLSKEIERYIFPEEEQNALKVTLPKAWYKNGKLAQDEKHVTSSKLELYRKSKKIPNIEEYIKSLHTIKSEYPEEMEIDQEPSPQDFLTEEQVRRVEQYFYENPGVFKLSRKQSGFPCSVIKDPTSGQLFAIANRNANYLDANKPGLLGEGSFGRVKLMKNLATEEIAAIKVQEINEDNPRKNIIKEEKFLDQLGQFLGAVDRNRTGENKKNKRYTAMKYLTGVSLGDYFDDNILPEQQKIDILNKVFTEVKLMHDSNIVHGDLSFNNILYDEKTGKVSIIDFGSAGKPKNKKTGLTEIAFQKDSFEVTDECYWAPFCLYGKGHFSADIYSLGREIKKYVVSFDTPIIKDLADKIIKFPKEWFNANDPNVLSNDNVTMQDLLTYYKQDIYNIDRCIELLNNQPMLEEDKKISKVKQKRSAPVQFSRKRSIEKETLSPISKRRKTNDYP